MPRIRNRIRTLVSGRPDVFRECRRCGTTIEADTDDCPVCGSTDIATYQLNH